MHEMRWDVLKCVRDGIRLPRDIAAALGWHPEDLGEALYELGRGGYIERDTENRIVLTRYGNQLFGRVSPVADD